MSVTLDDLRKDKRDWMYVQTQPIRFEAAPAKFEPDAQTVIRDVANKHGLLVKDLKGPSKARAAAHPRQEAMYRLAVERNLSLPAIGRLLGGRDHTTVLHGIRAYKKRAAETPGRKILEYISDEVPW